MRGLILKDFYNMLKNIGPTLLTTVCVGLLLMECPERTYAGRMVVLSCSGRTLYRCLAQYSFFLSWGYFVLYRDGH